MAPFQHINGGGGRGRRLLCGIQRINRAVFGCEDSREDRIWGRGGRAEEAVIDDDDKV